MLKKVIFQYFILGICLALGPGTFAQNSQVKIPLPNKAQLAWQEAELGVVFHYDLHVFDQKKYGQGNNRISPVSDYNIFNPEYLDTDQWIRTAKAMGAKFAILTATHETGFALYQSNVNPYCLKAIKWRDGKGDIVREFVNSCRKYDIKPGIYLGIRWNSFFGVHNFVVNGEGEFQKKRQEYYNQMVEGMVEEICTRYGELFEIWFDGGADHPDRGAPDVLPIVKKYQPTCLFYHNSQLAEARWGGSESGTVNYPCWATFSYPSVDQVVYKDINQHDFSLLKSGDSDGKYWMPAMSDAPLRGFNGRHEWFWEPGDEEHIFPLSHLLNMYYKSVGRNSTLILGLTPNPEGLMPDPDVRRLEEFGMEIDRRFNDPLGSTYKQINRTELFFNEEIIINHIILKEDIRLGERVRDFAIEGKVYGKWKTLVTGSCIGQKFIAKIDDIAVAGIRLKVLKSIAPVKIKEISVYNIFEKQLN